MRRLLTARPPAHAGVRYDEILVGGVGGAAHGVGGAGGVAHGGPLGRRRRPIRSWGSAEPPLVSGRAARGDRWSRLWGSAEWPMRIGRAARGVGGAAYGVCRAAHIGSAEPPMGLAGRVSSVVQDRVHTPPWYTILFHILRNVVIADVLIWRAQASANKCPRS